MYNKNILAKTLLLSLVMPISGFFHMNHADASQQWKGIKAEDVGYIGLAASIMEINVREGYLIIGDKKFYVADIRRDGKRYKTKLMDEEGGEVRLGFFRKGQMVFVGGFAVPDGRNAAFVIKRLSATEEARVKKGLKYDASKLMRRLRDSLNEKERHALDSSKFMRGLRDDHYEKERLSEARRRLRDDSVGKQDNQ